MNRPSRQISRRGFSIPEVLTAVILSVVVLSTASTLLHRMFAHQQASKASAQFHMAAGQVAHRFRTDVRSCEACESVDAGVNLKFTDGSTVTWRTDAENESTILRARNHDDGAHSDEFQFPTGCAIEIQRLADPKLNSDIAQLSIGLASATLLQESTPTATGDDAPARALLIESAVASDRRWRNHDE